MAKIDVWFDQEGDLLEVTIGKPRKGFFKPIEGEDAFVRVDARTGRIIGFTILNFTKKFRKSNNHHLKIPLPLKKIKSFQ